MESKAVEPDLGILECLSDTSPGEFFFLRSVAILFESVNHVCFLLGGEEPGGCGVVIDEEVPGDGNDDGQKALL